MPTTLPHPGAVVAGETQVQFTLFAPGKQRVSVIGDFNDWNPQTDVMQKVDDGLWSLRCELAEGDHAYQFDVDGTVICDPYARRLAEGDEKPHRAMVRIGDAPAFEWRHDDWPRPAFADLAIYELHIADFTPEGTFNAAIERLDYLRELGVNAIELMPVVEPDLDEGWGYQPIHFFACRRAYGTREDLMRLIDEAHARGMAVLLDIVLGHAGHGHPFNQIYAYGDSPWFGEAIGGVNDFGMPSFDHRRPPTQAYARDVQRYWLETFHLDGLRYDYAKLIGVDGDDGLPRVTRDARSVRGDVFLIAEFLPEWPSVVAQCELDGAWHQGASVAMKCLASESDHGDFHCDDFAGSVAALDHAAQGYGAASHMVNYLESHDEDRLIDDLIEAGWSEDAARRRAGLVATMLLTAPGVPMLYQGQELGSATDPKRNENNPMQWNLLDEAGGQGMRDHYAKLLHLRRDHAALRTGRYKIEAMNEGERWLVFHRWHDAGDRVTVALNFGHEARRVRFPLPEPRRWHDAIAGRDIERGDDGEAELELQPHEAAVLTPVGE